MDKLRSFRSTKWIDTNIQYILVNNLTDHKDYSDFVRSAVAKEIRRLQTLNKRQYKSFM